MAGLLQPASKHSKLVLSASRARCGSHAQLTQIVCPNCGHIGAAATASFSAQQPPEAASSRVSSLAADRRPGFSSKCTYASARRSLVISASKIG